MTRIQCQNHLNEINFHIKNRIKNIKYEIYKSFLKLLVHSLINKKTFQTK